MNNKTAVKNFSSLIKLSYNDLKTKKSSEFYEIIDKAYGKNGLGLIVISDVPDFVKKREKLFKNVFKLAHLDKKSLESLEKKELNYSVGWSRGLENYEDGVDESKGSFYAIVPNKVTGKTLHENVWPREIPDLKSSYLEVANQILDIGLDLTKHIDNYIKSVYPSFEEGTCHNHIKNSEFSNGRLLYYYPNLKLKPGEEQMWCGKHNDHGSLTGLCKAMYFDDSTGELSKETFGKTGLFIQNRKGEYVKGVYNESDIAFQIGESIQFLSGGLLHATPHCVKRYDDIGSNIGRVTYALFMQPNASFQMKIPKESSIDNIKTSNIYDVPKIQDRIKSEMTFGEFDKKTTDSYYNTKKL